MAPSLSKFEVCLLYTQFGKTFNAILDMTTALECSPNSLQVVYTMNTLLNHGQFVSRLNELRWKYPDEENPVVLFSSKCSDDFKKDYVHVSTYGELFHLCVSPLKTSPRIIIMCSNKTRFADGFRLLTELNYGCSSIKTIYMYFDELHAYINKGTRHMIETINEYPIIERILCLTATPDNLWEDKGPWSSIKLVDYGTTLTYDNYVGFSDSEFVIDEHTFRSDYKRPHCMDFHESTRQVVDYAKHIGDKYPSIFNDGQRVFIPGHKLTDGHDDIRTYVFGKNPNAVVILINGKEKTMVFKLGGELKVIDIHCGDADDMHSTEMCEKVGMYIKKYALEGRLIVFTGYICVNMGQTLTHESYGPFTAAIMGHVCCTNTDAYQLCGRLTGRMKHWKTFCKTTVYCPSKLMNRFKITETCNHNAIHNHSGSELTRSDYWEPAKSAGQAGKDVLDNMKKVVAPTPSERQIIQNFMSDGVYFAGSAFGDMVTDEAIKRKLYSDDNMFNGVRFHKCEVFCSLENLRKRAVAVGKVYTGCRETTGEREWQKEISEARKFTSELCEKNRWLDSAVHSGQSNLVKFRGSKCRQGEFTFYVLRWVVVRPTCN